MEKFFVPDDELDVKAKISEEPRMASDVPTTLCGCCNLDSLVKDFGDDDFVKAIVNEQKCTLNESTVAMLQHSEGDFIGACERVKLKVAIDSGSVANVLHPKHLLKPPSRRRISRATISQAPLAT